MRGREFGKPGVREAVILRLGATGECAGFAAITNPGRAAKIWAIERPERAFWRRPGRCARAGGPSEA